MSNKNREFINNKNAAIREAEKEYRNNEDKRIIEAMSVYKNKTDALLFEAGIELRTACIAIRREYLEKNPGSPIADRIHRENEHAEKCIDEYREKLAKLHGQTEQNAGIGGQ